MRRGTLITASIVAAWIIPAASFAAEGSATGATLQERMQTMLTRLEKRIPENTASLLPDPAKKKSWDAERKRHAERLAELRKKCREEIRKANRDTVVEKSGQCFRSDLLEELALQRKEETYVLSLPGTDAKKQAEYQTAIDALMDAEVAIVNGIDTGVYVTVESLESAKEKLKFQYRVPYWTALFHLMSDRQLPWLAWHIQGLGPLLADRPETKAEEVVRCFEDAVNVAYNSRGSESSVALDSLRGTLAMSRECAILLGNLIKTEE